MEPLSISALSLSSMCPAVPVSMSSSKPSREHLPSSGRHCFEHMYSHVYFPRCISTFQK
jgi:hypothetical protein